MSLWSMVVVSTYVHSRQGSIPSGAAPLTRNNYF